VEVVTPLDEDVLELLVYLVSRVQAGRVRYSQLVMIPSITSALSRYASRDLHSLWTRLNSVLASLT
jgi:hypothetical protein